MDDQQIDWSKLSKKERRRLIKEQKRQRQEAQQRQVNIRKWVIIGTVAVLIILGGFWFFKEASKPLPGEGVEDQGREHVSKEEWEKFKYNSNPPTSGPHDAVWTKAGVYAKPPGDGHLIHSLEHGYIVISHNCEMTNSKLGTESAQTSEGQKSNIKDQKERMESAEVEKVEEVDKNCLKFVEKLKQRVEKDAWKLILVPRQNLDTNFALTAWRRIDKFNTKDANMDRVNNFIRSLRNAGPEKTME